jgi:type I restriction enzyme S subunit
MTFPHYPTYKDSGVEWLGEVPAHWSVGRVRWLTRRYSGGTPDKAKLEYWENGTIPWLNSGAVNDRLINEPSAYITADAFANSSAKWIPEAALVMALAGQGKTKGMVAQLGFPSTCNQSMAAIIPGPEIAARFLFWWLESNYQNIRNMAGGDLRDGLNLELLGNIPCPLPTAAEQSQIVAFLDCETAKIDELVVEQRRLMELLKEKRQAVISHAVTKGLNPDVPMKESGIEWFGELPEHWSCGNKLKTLAQKFPAAFTNGPFGSDLLTAELQEEGVPVIYIRDLKVAGYSRTSSSYVTSQKALQLDKFRVDSGDILIAKVGDPPGFCCVYPKGEPPGIVCQDVIRMKPNLELISSDYLCFLLNSPPGIEAIDSICVELTRKRFSLADLHSLRLPIPPMVEQMEIAQRLNTVVVELDTLTTEAQRTIDLPQERRIALISAAVTGQIDVRQLAEKEAA